MTQYVRGRIYLADIGLTDENDRPVPKYMLIVSNNGRNKGLTALAVRLTTTHRPFASHVALPPGEVWTGYVSCDDVVQLYDEDRVKDAGALSPVAMRAVEEGLRIALGL
ncbi:mRNA-degrading endonuclease, toxin component of the MazEF toxin-antitoxin module [Quadrisphaera granulorum]|uniref:mRNA-degrading endonuclease toxin of MazEF toxin-antitoxin module n=1 Tax=Quadrisphaera granulorum TaxID=317664 RepID=A0A316ARV4_9ACTN|nr:type II toxin-antitoxin system PemK/MazF family toxin [Quadrisphaera granulorum]PWJ52827.1 mRNA-degrading endonuclease toxin of MazEF toxin-antitoxin module [Quadrisphaera granulorum]SZE97432.1 mRNA-degrading endonuclease, toxin component of the MazEF toxin-antitoxin module [Quadrisphaera granulorum]